MWLIIVIVINLCFYLWWKSTVIKTVPALQMFFPFGHFRVLDFSNGVNVATQILEGFTGASKLFQKEGMFYSRIITANCVFLTSAETIQDLLTNKEAGSKSTLMKVLKAFGGDGLITTDGTEQWKLHRKFVNANMGIKSLDKYLSLTNKQATEICGTLAQISDGKTFCLHPYIVRGSFNVAMEWVTGQAPKWEVNKKNEILMGFENFEDLYVACMANPIMGVDVWYTKMFAGKKFHGIGNTLRAYFTNLMQERRAFIADILNRKNDYEPDLEEMTILDSFVYEQMKNKSFNDVEIIDELSTLVPASYDTSATTLIWAIYFIGYYPEIQRKVQEELDGIFGNDVDREVTSADMAQMKYLTYAFKETLRLCPPVPMIGRKLNKNTEIGGRLVPKGTEVVGFIKEVHSDPRYFDNPEEFRPERFFPENFKGLHQYAYVPFSGGIRNCIGYSFAVKSALIMMSSIFRKFNVVSVQHRDQVHMKWGITGKADTDIMFRISPRISAPA